MELTGQEDGPPMVLGIPLPDMGTSEHAYGQLMKALYLREVTGRGSRIDLSMFESSASWLTVPISMTASFGKKVTRRGNTHEFFSPVSVYQTKNGFVYVAVGNDRQWKSLVSLDIFKSLDCPQYEKNGGRIGDVANLNRLINDITGQHTSEALITLFTSITVPISKINRIADVINDPLVEKKLLFSRDPLTGREITMAPPPYMTPFLAENNRRLSFPPRFGEHNTEIYQQIGYSQENLSSLREKGVI